MPGITKGSSCVFLIDHLGIDHHDSYAFGDGMNDIEMLELVGFGVAMGNANERIKALAKYSTKTNSENGVAHAVKRFVLNK